MRDGQTNSAEYERKRKFVFPAAEIRRNCKSRAGGKIQLCTTNLTAMSEHVYVGQKYPVQYS
jgi:hypothetical protein